LDTTITYNSRSGFLCKSLGKACTLGKNRNWGGLLVNRKREREGEKPPKGSWNCRPGKEAVQRTREKMVPYWEKAEKDDLITQKGTAGKEEID